MAKFNYRDGGQMFFNVKKEKESSRDPNLSFDVEILMYNTKAHKEMQKLSRHAYCQKKVELSIKREDLQIHNDGVPWYKNWWIDPSGFTDTYYIYFADCNGNLSKISSDDYLIFTFDTQTEEGGHFMKGEEYLLTIHYIFGLLTAVAYGPFIKKFIGELKGDYKEMNWPFMMINLIIVLKVVSTLFEVLELNFVQASGHGNDILSFIALSTNYFS